jgi:hypothetical protein
MTLSQLVVDVIKDIIKTGDITVNEQNLNAGLLDNDPQYSDLVNNAVPSINKAVARLVSQKKIPFKSFSVPVVYNSTTDSAKTSKKYTLSLPSDFYTVISIAYEDTKGRVDVVHWQTLSKTEYFLPLKKDGTFHIQYAPRVPMFVKADLNLGLELNDYGIDDTMAQYITFFTRADLWETEQPQLAQTYRQYAEEYYIQIENPVVSFRQESIYAKYNGDM